MWLENRLRLWRLDLVSRFGGDSCHYRKILRPDAITILAQKSRPIP